jgi:Restriction endonuclease BglII
VATLTTLKARKFQVEFHSHAEAILTHDFPEVLDELWGALDALTIPIEEIIAGGGGEAKGTQRLRKSLTKLGWPKTTFTVRKIINTVEREAVSHIVDHCRTLPEGVVALEIEWNNKDPFFDRDLENFKRLHADGAISVGILVTRGRDLHERMTNLVRRFVDERGIKSLKDLERWGYFPTRRQREAIERRVTRKKSPMTFEDAFVDRFVSDKFGEATTHWRKLEDRMHRGVGNPCPLLLIGLPENVVTFDEGDKALQEVLQEEENTETEDAADED